jgi:predicted RNA-binding Zn-ribbon protein involved in translation (DUF1610 family)
MILYCRLCDTGLAVVGSAIPLRCPSCGRETKWRSAPMREHLASAIMWTPEDRRLLRSFRIATE